MSAFNTISDLSIFIGSIGLATTANAWLSNRRVIVYGISLCSYWIQKGENYRQWINSTHSSIGIKYIFCKYAITVRIINISFFTNFLVVKQIRYCIYRFAKRRTPKRFNCLI